MGDEVVDFGVEGVTDLVPAPIVGSSGASRARKDKAEGECDGEGQESEGARGEKEGSEQGKELGESAGRSEHAILHSAFEVADA